MKKYTNKLKVIICILLISIVVFIVYLINSKFSTFVLSMTGNITSARVSLLGTLVLWAGTIVLMYFLFKRFLYLFYFETFRQGYLSFIHRIFPIVTIIMAMILMSTFWFYWGSIAEFELDKIMQLPTHGFIPFDASIIMNTILTGLIFIVAKDSAKIKFEDKYPGELERKN